MDCSKLLKRVKPIITSLFYCIQLDKKLNHVTFRAAMAIQRKKQNICVKRLSREPKLFVAAWRRSFQTCLVFCFIFGKTKSTTRKKVLKSKINHMQWRRFDGTMVLQLNLNKKKLYFNFNQILNINFFFTKKQLNNCDYENVVHQAITFLKCWDFIHLRLRAKLTCH